MGNSQVLTGCKESPQGTFVSKLAAVAAVLAGSDYLKEAQQKNPATLWRHQWRATQYICEPPTGAFCERIELHALVQLDALLDGSTL
jgi:hypothetical protein